MAKRKRIVTQGQLKELVRYNPRDGVMLWRKRSIDTIYEIRVRNAWNTKLAGKEVGQVAADGYRMCKVLSVKYRVHRLIWLYVHGEWPDEVDHVNGVRDDNRLANLRNVSMLENRRNRKLNRNSITGVLGVNISYDKYTACIRVGGHSIYLGTFNTIEEAASARKDADRKYGFHENHGRP